MSEEKNLVGKKINLKKLAVEVEKNNNKLKVKDFMNVFFMVMEDFEENHPLAKEMKSKMKDDYEIFVMAVAFMIMVRLSQITLPKKEFIEMIERTAEETVEMPTPSTKDMN